MPEHTEAKSCVQCLLYSTLLFGAHGYCLAGLHSAFVRAALFLDHLARLARSGGREFPEEFAPRLQGMITGSLFAVLIGITVIRR